MIASATSCNTPAAKDSRQDVFLALLPKIQLHAAIYFRYIRCPAKKADKVADAVALAWKWFLRLQERGKDINNFRMVFVILVARAVKSGRRLTGMEKIKDVFSERAQRRSGFRVEPLGTGVRANQDLLGVEIQELLDERLRDNTVTPPPDAAAFRIDFPQWRSTWGERDRRLIDLLMLDARTQDAARSFRISAGRVSQKRREFHDDWLRFHGEYCASFQNSDVI